MQSTEKIPELKKNLAALGFFVFCAIVFFAFKIAQGYVLAPEDDFVQNFPAFASPMGLWTPLLLTGFPILADPQVQFFYPLAWLARHLPLGADLTANFNLYIISAFVLAAYFAFLLARKITGSFYAGLIAGLSYGFSGYFISELKHVQVLHTAVWLPLLLYLVEVVRGQFEKFGGAPAEVSAEAHAEGTAEAHAKGTAEAHAKESAEALAGVLAETSGKRKPIVSVLLSFFFIGLVVACTVFAGHPQTALYVLVTVLAYGIFVVTSLPKTKTSILFLLPFLLALASGIAISAVQLLPSMELSSLSGRTDFSYADFVIGQVEPMQIVGFAIPYIMGGAYGTLGTMPFSEQGPPPGLLFIGFAPLILALYGARKNKDQKKRIWFLAILALLALTLSLGAHTPLSRLVYYLPFFGSFRGLYRVLILFTFAISMLSAIGLAQLEKEYAGETPLRQPLDPGKLGPSKHIYVLLYIALSCFSYPFLLGSLPLLLFFVKIERLQFLYGSDSSLRQNLLLLASLFVLALYAVNAEWSKASPLATDFKPPQVAVTYGAETAKSNSRIFTIKGLEGERDQLPPNLSRLWGVASATGYEPLVPKRYSSLLGISEGGFMQPPWQIKGANRVLDIACVKYMFAPWGDFSKRAFDEAATKKWKLKEAADKTLIYENLDVLPRFYLVPEARFYSTEGVRAVIITGHLLDGKPFEPREIVLIDSNFNKVIKPVPASTQAQAVKPPSDGDRITSYDLGDERLVFNISMSRRGYLVLADLFYPGWQTTVDGANTDILPANYVQRAVRLEAGIHTVIFKYVPESLARGRSICLATLFAWLIIVLAALVWKKTKR